ncbi:MAG: hypothetical protein EOM26_09270 [Alphaproteobacteria bacterium]|nr:hypothetical protein [Alphaproteobacteria bacterium]
MSYLWFFVWFVLSAFILGAFLWSIRVLMQQKKAWQAYAKKYKLPYNKGRFLMSPSIVGDFQNHRLNIYSEEQLSEDTRGTRFRSVVELMRSSDVDASGAIASGHLVPVLNLFDLHEVFAVESELWMPSYSGRTNDVEAMKQYITPERFQSLNRLFRNPKAGFIVIFNPQDILLRYETSDPLHDPRRLDKLVRLLLEMSEALKLPERLVKSDSLPANESPEHQVPSPATDVPDTPAPGAELESGLASAPEASSSEVVSKKSAKKAAPKKKAASRKPAAPKSKDAL